MMTDQEVAAHLRKVHGITEETTYDPDLHASVPAMCFGPIPASNRVIGNGASLDPEIDLVQALAEAAKEDADQ